jgi:hypothetical protein
MGTSSARRGPTTGLWRAAKGAATRYLTPAAGGEVCAGEVVARYLAAQEETSGPGETLAAFRLTRRAAQDLGALGEEAAARGWEAALAGRGLASAGPEAALALAQVVAGGGGGLEAAVVRTALALTLQAAMASGAGPDAVQLARRFLAAAVYLRLVLDLGESLEAAAGGYGRLRDGLGRIQAVIEEGLAGTGELPAPPGQVSHWQGLAGWAWVTAVIAGLLDGLKVKPPKK